jgi:hypothetical protein
MVEAQLDFIENEIARIRGEIPVVSPPRPPPRLPPTPPPTPPPPPPPPQQRIWEFIRYYKYQRANPKSNKNINFEVHLWLPFPAEYTESNVIRYERVADDIANEALDQFFKQPEVTGHDRNTAELLLADVSWDFESRGWEPGLDTEDITDIEVNVTATVEDKTEYWHVGPVTFMVEGVTWRIPE